MTDSTTSATRRPSIAALAATDRATIRLALMAGAAACLTIFVLAHLTSTSKLLLLIAPFGASCVLVFGLPDSPLAQNRNLIGGHILSAAVGLIVFHSLGTSPLAYGIGVGCAIAVMIITKTTHPPAGADPIVVIAAGSSWSFLLTPILAGTLVIASFGWLWRSYRRKAGKAR